jgi:O-antigen biosynthesis protein
VNTHEIPSAAPPLVTVAVCTRDRPKSLKRCLESLVKLDYQHFEILVIDNASNSPETAQVVAGFPKARYVFEPRAGLSWARNRAIREATGTIIAFTDDDIVADPSWLAALVKAFNTDGAACVTGNVKPFELETDAQRLFEQYGGLGCGEQRRVYTLATPTGRSYPISAHIFGAGANMAFQRDVFEKIKPFDTALGAGTEAQAGEDMDIFFRIVEADHTLVFEPAALVYHIHRSDYAALHRQLRDYGKGYYAYLTATFMNYPKLRFKTVRFAVWWLLYWNIGRLLRETWRPTGFPRRLIFAQAIGSCYGPYSYFKASRQARRVAEATYKPVPWLDSEVKT